MPIVVTCAGCNSNLKAPDAAAGKRIKCPKCETVIGVPNPDAGIAPTADAEYGDAPGFTPDAPPPVPSPRGKIPTDAPNKIVVGLMGILLGGFGVHKFMLGYSQAGTIMLVGWIVGLFCTLGIASTVIGVIGLIEGILYITKSDEDFYQTYVANKKEWF